MNKLLKRNKDLIIISSILIILLVFMVLISSSFAYFLNSKSASGNIELSELDYNINVNNISKVYLLPGDEVEINVSIENFVEGKGELVPFYFRFKILNQDIAYNLDLIKLSADENYIKDENYYYYKYKLKYKDSAKILDKVVIDSSLTKEDILNLDISIFVDAVQSEYGAYSEVFYDAPEEWIEFIENN